MERGEVADEWLSLQEVKQQSEPQGGEKENDYLLVKWFRLELHLNPVRERISE